MNAANDSNSPFEHRPVRLLARPDLSFDRQTHQGQTWWVVKDPLSLRYFRLRDQQYALLQMLNGQITPAEIKEEIERRFPTMTVTYSHLQSLLGMFHQNNLVLSETDGQGEQLLQRRDKRWRRQVVSKLLSVLWIRLPGVDPDRFLSWLHPKVRWLFAPWCVALCLLLLLGALTTVMVHFDQFYSRLPDFHQFFSARNAVWLMLALAVSKILHELGHGLACKHFGGECHQIGIMFLVFTPCLYCDTSDSWMLPNRWHRAMIGAAGMYVELILASFCTFVWWNSQPGLIHYLCLNVMFISSISTVVFNINPLLRYDGYYILSDLLEVPNLSQKARSALIGTLRQWCLGLPWKQDQVVPPRQRLLFASYAVASTCYRWFVVIAILWFLSSIFEPYGLQPIGHLLIAMSLVSIIVVPLWQIVQYFHVPGRLRQVNKKRLAASCVILLIAACAVALVPLPHYVMTTVVIQPRDAERIYVNIPGTLESIRVQPGRKVTENVTLAVLNNPEIAFEVAKLDGQRRRLARQLESLRRQQIDDRNSAQPIPHTEEALANVVERLDRLRLDQQRLTLVSHSTGVVMPPPKLPKAVLPKGHLATWSGTPLELMNKGTWLDSGVVICLIGNPDNLEAVLVIDQNDIDFVRAGQTVKIRLDEYPTRTWQGTIEEIATLDLQMAPRELSQKAGGDLTTTTDKTGSERPATVSYQARVPLKNVSGRVSPGFRGRAKIHAGSRPLGSMICRFLVEAFRL